MNNNGTVLNKEDILSKGDGFPVSGYAYIRSYSEQPTKNGSSFLSGHMECKGDIAFKVWRGSAFDSMKADDMQGSICYINAEVNEYNGQKSLIINSIIKVDSTELSEVDFLVPKYNTESFWSSLVGTLEKNVTAEALNVFKLVMGEYTERFKLEYAAINHHDNCLSGLLAHTNKVLKAGTILKMYPEIIKKVDADVLYVGMAIHDIGKVLEYSMGSISEVGKIISHNTIGISILEGVREDIIKLKGETFYYTMLSIISQHHGEFGERPRTVAAYVVHLFDMLESRLATVSQMLEELDGDMIVCEGYKLSV